MKIGVWKWEVEWVRNILSFIAFSSAKVKIEKILKILSLSRVKDSTGKLCVSTARVSASPIVATFLYMIELKGCY